MTTPRGFRDRADDSFLTLLGDLPELIRNLIVAEVDAAKQWVSHAAKDGKWGAIWVFVALFLLFWMIPAFGAFVIAGLSSWWPVWLSALVVAVVMLLAAVVFALLAFLRFRSMVKRQNPVQAIAQDIKEMSDEL